MSFRLCWYVGDKYLRELKASSWQSYPLRVKSSILALAEHLVSEVRMLEKGSEHSRKETRDHIPSERIKDAPAMARELLWRARLLLHGSASDEEAVNNDFGNFKGGKRKRSTESPGVDDSSSFKNFKPKKWDSSTEKVLEKELRTVRLSRPEDEKWKERWSEWRTLEDEGDAQLAQVTHFRDVLIRVRKTSRGLERQRIERTVEELVWEHSTERDTT
jgi:hypothetical protein